MNGTAARRGASWRTALSPLALFNWLILAVILAPLAVVVYVSFTPSSFLELPAPTDLSLRWYREAFRRADFLDALVTSLLLGVAATSLAVTIGTLAAYAISRYRFAGRDLVDTLLMAPLMVPGVILGLFLLIFLTGLRLTGTFVGLLAAHVLLTIPYAVRTVRASLRGLDPNLERAARNLGASWLQALLLVTVPLIRPGLLAGAIFAFLMSFDNLTVSIFLTDRQFMTLPVRMYYYVVDVTDPVIASVSTLLILLSLVLVLVMERLFGLRRIFES